MPRDGTTHPALAASTESLTTDPAPLGPAPPVRRRLHSEPYSVRGDRVPANQPLPAEVDVLLAALRPEALAVVTLRADRSVVAANAAARRLLQHRIGLELDQGCLRCTDPFHASRFARMVSDAAVAARKGKELSRAFELRPGVIHWLDVVVTAHHEKGVPHALVILRSRP